MDKSISYDTERTPPSFTEARTRRQKVRAAGMNPDYWYPVEYALTGATGWPMAAPPAHGLRGLRFHP